MRKGTVGLLVGALLMLALSSLGCSVSQVLVRRPVATLIPTRTPRPTWTPFHSSPLVATATLDVTRFPGITLPTVPPPTAQVLVPGSGQPIFVPQPAEGGTGVQTVVVIVVTATPIPPPTGTPLPPTKPPPATATPGPPPPPTATSTATGTPLPPVMVEVTVDQANVRQGPGTTYPIVTRLDAGTTVTVVGRNRAGDWWKICCVNGSDVWIADSVVRVTGPLWTVPEVTNIPPAPPAPPTTGPTATPAPTATYAWTFRVEGKAEEYLLGQNYFRVAAVIYNGATPLWGYKLRIRKLSTGQEWLSSGSESYWKYETIQFGANPSTPQVGLKYNVKWDSNGVGVSLGDDVWEVIATDGAGNALSAPVRFYTSVANSKWYYVVFTSRR
jgi:hypothetical protein